jgi:hypothetical protein
MQLSILQMILNTFHQHRKTTVSLQFCRTQATILNPNSSFMSPPPQQEDAQPEVQTLQEYTNVSEEVPRPSPQITYEVVTESNTTPPSSSNIDAANILQVSRRSLAKYVVLPANVVAGSRRKTKLYKVICRTAQQHTATADTTNLPNRYRNIPGREDQELWRGLLARNYGTLVPPF